jgi:hypothetical protein
MGIIIPPLAQFRKQQGPIIQSWLRKTLKISTASLHRQRKVMIDNVVKSVHLEA